MSVGLFDLKGAVEFIYLFGQLLDFIILKAESGDVIGVLNLQVVYGVAQAADSGLENREVGAEFGDEQVGLVGATV